MHNIGQWDAHVLLTQMRCALAEVDVEETRFILIVLCDMLEGAVDWPEQGKTDI